MQQRLHQSHGGGRTAEKAKKIDFTNIAIYKPIVTDCLRKKCNVKAQSFLENAVYKIKLIKETKSKEYLCFLLCQDKIRPRPH